MKITVVLLFAVLAVAWPRNAEGQDARVTLNVKNETVADVLQKLEKQSNYFFFYNNKEIDVNRRVSIRVRGAELQEVLGLIFGQTGVRYSLLDNSIILSNREIKMTETAAKMLRQGIVVTGIVSDDKGAPLPGASVSLKGTQQGVVTDADGKYSITVPDGSAVLSISFVGYTTVEETVGDRRDIPVTLTEGQQIEEVVVVGYGQQRKETLTGAVAAIRADDIVTTKNGNPQNTLAGKIAGVKIAQRTSEPGVFNGEFSIRGMGTPLFIIDGVPRDNMPRMDANEIESISVLKDASAAVYGVRAANGVILVNTKKGKKGQKFQFDYTGYVGIESFMKLKELKAIDAISYMTLKNEQNYNNHNTDTPFPWVGQPGDAFTPYINGDKQSQDWMWQFVNEHPIETQHTISASGGTDKIQYFTSIGYYKQNGIWKSGDAWYDRWNLRSNVSAELVKGLKAEVFLALSKDHRNRQGDDSWRIFDGLWGNLPINQVFIDGDKNFPGNAGNNRHAYVMSTASLSGYQWYENKYAQTNLSLTYDIPGVEGLKVRGMYSYDYRGFEEKDFRIPQQLYNADKTPGGYNGWKPTIRKYVGMSNTLMQLQAMYDRSFGKHNVGALVLYEEGTRYADNFTAQRDGTLFTVEQLFAGASSTQQASQSTSTELDPNNPVPVLYEEANKAVVGRFTYDYASKYLFEFSFREDGSSRFAPKHQWGFFPAVSAGWRISEESFIKEGALSFINNLKIRGSYGMMGDDGNLSYQFLSGYDYPSGNGYVFGGALTNTINMRGIPNTELTWITAKTADIGLDLDMWNGKLGLIVDVYQRDRDGLMATRQIALPGELGAGVAQENLNSDRTRGLEITLSHRNKLGDFKYWATVFTAFDKSMNRYIEEGEFGNSYRQWRSSGNNRNWNIFWAYGSNGQYQNFDQIFAGPMVDGRNNAYVLPGDVMLEDWNEDGIIDDNDVHPIDYNAKLDGKMKPHMTYGATLGAEWKGIDLNIVIQGSGRAMRFDNDPNIFLWPLAAGNAGGWGGGWQAFADRWHRADETNPTKWQEWVPGKYPSVYSQNGRDFNANTSTWWIYNAAYFRIKSLELGYTLPQQWTKKVAIDKLRVFFNGFNLLTISKAKTLDPEQPERYPLAQSYNFGLNLTF